MLRFGLIWLMSPPALLRDTLALTCGLTLLVLLAGIGGGFSISLPTYLDSGDCPQPCWLGLRPGETTVAQALDIILASSLTIEGSVVAVEEPDAISYLSWETRNFPSYDARARFRSGLLMRMNLYPDGELRLAETFAMFGTPSHALLCQRVMASINYRRAVFATLYFLDGAVEVTAYTPDADVWQVRPDMQVQQIAYHTLPSDGESWVPLGTAPWHGFGRTEYSGMCR